MLRTLVVAELEGERDHVLSSRDEIEKLARAIENCTSGQFPDLVGSGSSLPVGARVCLNLPDELTAHRMDDQRRHVAFTIRKMADGVQVRIKTRPRRTPRAATMDLFSAPLFENDMSLQDLSQA